MLTFKTYCLSFSLALIPFTCKATHGNNFKPYVPGIRYALSYLTSVVVKVPHKTNNYYSYFMDMKTEVQERKVRTGLQIGSQTSLHQLSGKCTHPHTEAGSSLFCGSISAWFLSCPSIVGTVQSAASSPTSASQGQGLSLWSWVLQTQQHSNAL
jgi:hypothetical protein